MIPSLIHVQYTGAKGASRDPAFTRGVPCLGNDVCNYQYYQYSSGLHGLNVWSVTPGSGLSLHISAGVRQVTSSSPLQLEPKDEVFLAIAKAMEGMVEDNVNCYWII